MRKEKKKINIYEGVRKKKERTERKGRIKKNKENEKR